MLRAGIVVTGTEVLTGRVADANGPWLSEHLREVGVDVAHICVCGDRKEDLLAQLQFLTDQDVDIIVTSGGLGPTADDMTLPTVAEFAGTTLIFDADLEAAIMDRLRPMANRWENVDWEALRVGIAKQALVPAQGQVLDPVGTAPGAIMSTDKVVIVVLPGPPHELQRMWPSAVDAAPFRALVGEDAAAIEQTTLRLYGITEPDIAETLRLAEDDLGSLAALEITTCLRRSEVEVVTRFEPSARSVWESLYEFIHSRHGSALFSSDGWTVDEVVAGLLHGRRLAVAESCTAGLLGARLADVPGSSAYFLGGIISYANDVKIGQLHVDPQLLADHGAVSPQVAEAMADGALAALGADIAVSTTGVAGPGGGSADKPVGTVCFCVKTAAGERAELRVVIPGNRNQIRERATTVALHLLRRLLQR
ncbi:competence/damage-inducible protein A [Mycobacteroides franklinii]|uniref:CinA-like protein n=1 Tax=Mycobacteroides franklinii TaxID=948102 RepID=A0A4R8QYA1_9MYCO|nr:competence/damage-inducible protein A [Mycobacteroides franklinii]ORA58620.1 competence/damage-inducible protein A [Mycobacteroides franklinii]TDH24771.1 competence/damage-inducible protein A [Mycobacteroides franklinii]TDZ45054.1 Nicotinamide-nucleotide amidohydrolase PncC [Mycobacteroides franklinii]TDZ48544.1 Nicotinamide-nucleotide amidohydrolase PncC [Mycobacteroides franklinii]TDZ58724.1 Nicotinamide-nucleotide amidohydrolase PncC [Mycobacteroides franklinii]